MPRFSIQHCFAYSVFVDRALRLIFPLCAACLARLARALRHSSASTERNMSRGCSSVPVSMVCIAHLQRCVCLFIAFVHPSCVMVSRCTGTDDEGSSEITRFTDKHLMNFWLIGIIHMVFPNARIVHTLRDPMDTLFSCYKHRFEKGSIDFSYSQVWPGFWFGPLLPTRVVVDEFRRCSYPPTRYALQEHLAQFYVLYRAVMEHWEATVPASKLLTIRYEELVNDQETYGW